jgi:hypothetical protein
MPEFQILRPSKEGDLLSAYGASGCEKGCRDVSAVTVRAPDGNCSSWPRLAPAAPSDCGEEVSATTRADQVHSVHGRLPFPAASVRLPGGRPDSMIRPSWATLASSALSRCFIVVR